MFLYRKNILFILFTTFSFSQNASIKYSGNNEENILLTCHSIEFLETPTVINKNKRNLLLTIANPSTLLCNQIGRNTMIYITPNEEIEFDINEKGLIDYFCKTNNYRKLESEFINECYEKYGNTENISNYNELKQIRLLNGLSKYFDKNYIKEQELLERYYKNDKVSKDFYQYFTKMYWCLVKYNELENEEINPDILLSIEKSFIDSDFLLNIADYKELLWNYLAKSLKKLGIKNDLFTRMVFISNNISNQKIKDFLLYTNMKSTLDNRFEKTVVDLKSIDIFKKNCKNKEYLDKINQDLLPNTTPLILQNILKKYKGKLVLVDFWASWCMPCREEFPYEKKLMSKYPTVSFVFISTDRSKVAWQKAMSEYDYILNKENSFLLIKSEKDDLLRNINLTTIPRYVLFGKDGRIINADTPRPSDINIETLILKHL